VLHVLAAPTAAEIEAEIGEAAPAAPEGAPAAAEAAEAAPAAAEGGQPESGEGSG